MTDCPLPYGDYDHVVIGHGGGGTLADELLRSVFLPAFESSVLAALEDAAVVPAGGERIALTTDAFVVRPSFFPGGDVGRLAVSGTVNDLACVGARPLYLTAAFILEEGLLLSDLRRIAQSMRTAAEEAGVEIVAGDTKVVERGSGDGVYITTSGVGAVPQGRDISVARARPGDAVLLSGSIADHGMAVLSVRAGLELEGDLSSDCAPLAGLAETLAATEVHVLRDPTRGGVAGVLHEIARASGVGIQLREDAFVVRPAVRAACELLGFDPLHVANEGKLVVIVPEAAAKSALAALRSHPLGREAARVGTVTEQLGAVTLQTRLGTTRRLTQLSGEQLPRIC